MKKKQEDENAAIKKSLTDEQYKNYTTWQENQRKEMEKRREERGGQRGPAQSPDNQAKNNGCCKSKECKNK